MGWVFFILTLPLLAFSFYNYPKARTVINRDACVANLKQIDIAKEAWALEHKKRAGESCEPESLKPHLQMAWEQIQCPSGGRYTVEAIGKHPECTATSHRLE